MFTDYKYENEYKPMKTNEQVYEEIRDKEEFIAAKLLGKKQHAVYMEQRLYDRVFAKAKHEGRSFNNMLVRLVLKGLEQDV
jgi:hypothetical protein